MLRGRLQFTRASCSDRTYEKIFYFNDDDETRQSVCTSVRGQRAYGGAHSPTDLQE